MPERFGGLADRAPGGVARLGRGEDGGPDEPVDRLGAEPLGIRDDDTAVVPDGAGPDQGFTKLGGGRVEVHAGSSIWRNARGF